MFNRKPETLPEIKKLEYKPGDTFILELPDTMPVSFYENLKSQWAEHWKGIEPVPKLFVLERGMKLRTTDIDLDLHPSAAAEVHLNGL